MKPDAARGSDVAWGGAYMILGAFVCLAFLLFDYSILLGAWLLGVPMIIGGYAVLRGGIDDGTAPLEGGGSPIARQQPFPPDTKREVWARDGGACALCGTRIDLQFAHVDPENGDDPANLRVICGSCDRSLARPFN